MVPRKDWFGEVAFGGAWAEDIPREEDLVEALGLIGDAAEACGDRDVDGDALRGALRRVRLLHRGPAMAEAFLAALRTEDPDARRDGARRVARMIRDRSGAGPD